MTRTTIAKVAAEAGVGVGTVSRVLNGSPSVSEDTRRRVLEAIAVLDYQPSAVARALSTGRTHAIAVVAPFFTQPSVIERLRGVSQTLAGSGYQLILLDVERAEQRRDVFRSSHRPRALRRRAGDLAGPHGPRGAPARGGRHPDRAARPRSLGAARDHDRRRRRRPDGGRAPAGARPPPDRLRGRRGGEPVRVRLQRPPAGGLRGGARRRRGPDPAGMEPAPPPRTRRRSRGRR